MQEIQNDQSIDIYRFYNNYYIKIDERNRIIDGWSDGPNPDKDITNAICINEEGSYQFRLYPGGEENPNIYTLEGIPKYEYVNNQISLRSEEDIQDDLKNLPEPAPTELEQMRADIDFISVMAGIEL